MISIFGIISVIIALISVTVIVLHNRLMLKRSPVDSYLAELEDLVREKIESLYHESRPDSELRALCAQCIDLDLNGMMEALPEIEVAQAEELSPDENTGNHTISETVEALNQSIHKYNRLITGSSPMRLMARVLALTLENPIDYQQPYVNDVSVK